MSFAYEECEAKSKHEMLWKQREAKMRDDEEFDEIVVRAESHRGEVSSVESAADGFGRAVVRLNKI